MPYLSLTFESSLKGESFGLLVANQGIRPAFIEAIIIVEDTVETEIDIVEYLYKPYPKELNSFKINNSIEEIGILQKIVYELSEKGIGLKIIYSSVYGDVWQLNVEENISEKIANYETAL